MHTGIILAERLRFAQETKVLKREGMQDVRKIGQDASQPCATLSIGVADIGTITDLTKAVEKADRALYAAKRTRNSVVFIEKGGDAFISYADYRRKASTRLGAPARGERLQHLGEPRRNAGAEADTFRPVFLGRDRSLLVDEFHQVVAIVRELQLDFHRPSPRICSILARSSGTPCAVRALTAIVSCEPPMNRCASPTGRRSILFHTRRRGTAASDEAGENLVHGRDLLRRGGDASCPPRAGSARLPRCPPALREKAATRSCGSLRMNPTVSVRSASLPPGRASRRVVGSSVAKSLSWTRTPAPVIAFISELLPALV